MVRTPTSPYKCGRSSTKEGYLLKVKRFEDAEGIVVRLEEEMENTNEATMDAFGRTERSSHKENLIPKGTMGKLICRWFVDGERDEVRDEFGIGTGFTAAMRAEFWKNRAALVGKIAKFKYQAAGMAFNGRPRIPVFKGWRDKWDM